MKPKISSVSIASQPTADNITGGSIVIGGLTAETKYKVIYALDGNPTSLEATADQFGQVTVTSIAAGKITGLTVTDTTAGENDDQTSDAYSENLVIETYVGPAAPLNVDQNVSQGTATGTEVGNTPGTVSASGETSSTGSALASDPSTGITMDHKQGVVNDYLGNAHEGGDAREAVIIASEVAIKDIRALVERSTNLLPSTKKLLDIFAQESVNLIEDTTTEYLDKLRSQEQI